jgi:hypothetical protein
MRVKVAYNLHRVMVWNYCMLTELSHMGLQRCFSNRKVLIAGLTIYYMLTVDSRVTAWKNDSGASFREPLTS